MLSFVIHLRIKDHKLYVNSGVIGCHPKSSIREHKSDCKVELNSGIIKGEFKIYEIFYLSFGFGITAWSAMHVQTT